MENYDTVIEIETGSEWECSPSYKKYTLNGKLHRIDGPAMEWSDGDNFWYLNGQLHRTDGPAWKFTDPNEKHSEEFFYYKGTSYPSIQEWFEAMDPADKSNGVWLLDKTKENFAQKE